MSTRTYQQATNAKMTYKRVTIPAHIIQQSKRIWGCKVALSPLAQLIKKLPNNSGDGYTIPLEEFEKATGFLESKKTKRAYIRKCLKELDVEHPCLVVDHENNLVYIWEEVD